MNEVQPTLHYQIQDMCTTTHMHELTTQYATISFFCFLLHIINCHIIRASIVHGNCKQPVYTPLLQTSLNRSTYGVPFVNSYRAKVQDFLLVSPIPINEVCGDYHVVQFCMDAQLSIVTQTRCPKKALLKIST